MPAPAATSQLPVPAALRRPAAELPPAQRRAVETSREFEAVFLAQVLNTMTAGLGERTGFDGGHAEGQWRGVLNEHLARHISRSGGVGVADAVARQMLRAQEAR
jgi:Rod binding domain-containing protein